MVQTIQVLCIHLRELEKVNELCKDFCTRYITCLKQKYLVDVLSELDSPDASVSGGAADDSLSDAGLGLALAARVKPGEAPSPSAFRPVTDYQTYYAAGNFPPRPLYYSPCPSVPPFAASSNAFSTHRSSATNATGDFSASTAAFALTSPGSAANNVAAPRSTSAEADTTAKAQKRGVLPKQATQVMKSWLFQHLVVRASP